MTVEVGVLDRHHGLSEGRWHLRERDQDPVHARVELRDLVPGTVEEFGRLLQGRDVRQLGRHEQCGERAGDGQ
ncbi:MAG TPA: hypothetical protein VMR89_12715 [Actinomycetota bacterium]|nr:hypothetical protein [Actinomycetota bacterium]